MRVALPAPMQRRSAKPDARSAPATPASPSKMRRFRRLRRMVKRFGFGRGLAVVLLLAMALVRIWDPAPIEALRLQTFDLYQSIKPRVAAQRPVVIVDIDEDSLKSLGQWPWPRTLVADLVQRLTAQGALAIGFDIIFPEPDRSSPAMVADSFPGLDEELRNRLKSLPSNDQVLAATMGRSKVILGESGVPTPTRRPEGATPHVGFGVRGPVSEPGLVTFPGLLRNIPVLEQTATGRGILTLRPERDGIVRRVPIVMRAEGNYVPSLSIEMLRVVSGSSAILLKTDHAGMQSIVLRGLEIPTDGVGQQWVHFSPHDRARYVSAKDVLEGRMPPDRVAGRLVLIGTSAVGLLDIKTTPIDPVMPGVEIHAQLLESMLTKTALTWPNWATLAELCLALVVSLGLIAFAPLLGAWALFALIGVLAAALIGFSWYYYTTLHTLIDATFPLGTAFLISVTAVFTNYLKAQAERRQIRSAFNQYLSPALVEQLAQSPEKLVLGGEERNMTVMFSDVRGFTAISELYKNDPQRLTALMNRLLTPLTNAIIDEKGTIDKYMGDAVMAFWNAPLDVADHEAHACEAALHMLDELTRLNEQRRLEAEAAGEPFLSLNIGIGLNTGPCVVGNMGSDLHFNYSVLGDTVNLASRLEGQSKYYGVQTVLGSRTAERARDRYAVIELDFLQVKGKSEPETIYTVLGRKDGPEAARFERLAELNAIMLEAYRARDWTAVLEAILLCREAARGLSLDEFYNLYVSRVRTLRETPPEEDWNGVWVADRK
jgi:adenylate cyclase